MFSWSKHSKYPAQRISQTNTPVAQSVQGSIRPPTTNSASFFPSSSSANTFFTRQQHLDSYLKDDTLKRSTRQLAPGNDSTYDTVFQTTLGNALILRVHLPSASAGGQQKRPPAMTLVGVRATHPWLDAKMQVVGYPKIQTEEGWAGQILGTCVLQVVQYFQLNPPTVLEIRDEGLRKLQATLPKPPNGANGATASTTQPSASLPPPNYNTTFSAAPSPDGVQLPRIPEHFEELDDMTRTELQRVLDDELDFLQLVHKIKVYKELQSKRAAVLEENETMAMTNLEKEQEYIGLYQETTELQKTFREKLSVFEALSKEQAALCAPPDPRLTLKRLYKAKKEALEESEEYAAEFVEDGGDVREFVRTFLEKRQTFHIRAAKEERLQQQQQQQQSNIGLIR